MSKEIATIGGLTDDDAFATRPPITSKPVAKKGSSKDILTQDLGCTNNVCIFIFGGHPSAAYSCVACCTR